MPAVDAVNECNRLKTETPIPNVNSQRIFVTVQQEIVLPKSRPHVEATLSYSGPQQEPTWTNIKPTISTPVSTMLHTISARRLTQRDDPGLNDPGLKPAVLDPDIVWASVVPNPPPPYTPTVALHASTLAPVPINQEFGRVQDVPTSKIAFIVTCIVLSLMLGAIIVREASKGKLVRKKNGTVKSGFRFRMPKFPNMRGRTVNEIEGLSWNMENGSGMATSAEFDDRTWGTPMYAKGTPPNASEVETPIITAGGQNSPNTRSHAMPWSVSLYRSSCPPALATFITDFDGKTNQTRGQVTSISLSIDRSFSQVGALMLNTKHEDCTDMFVEQETNAKKGLDWRDSGQGFSYTSPEQMDPRPISVDLTSAESISTILALTSAATRSAGKRERSTRGRARQGSDASRSTEASTGTDTDSSSDAGSESSSSTSITTTVPETDEDGDEESEMGGEGMELFELKTVTNSMEVKRGVLLALAKGQADEGPPEMPKLVVSGPISHPKPTFILNSTPSEGTIEEEFAEDRLLHSKLITESSSSSLMTLGSSVSGTSINLDDFPSPPTSLLIPSITFTLSTDAGPITLMYE